MKKVHVVLLAVALILSSLGTARAFCGDFGGHRGGGPGMHGGFMRMLDRLDLTDDQESQVAAILKHHRDEIGNAAGGMDDAQKAMVNAAMTQPRSEEAVKQAATKMGDAMAQFLVLRSSIMSEIEQVLTPDQLQKMEKMRAKFLARLDKVVDRRLARLDEWISDHE